MENTPLAPVPVVAGYDVHSLLFDNRWTGAEQHRVRRFSFGSRDGRRLAPSVAAVESPVFEYAVTSSGGGVRCLRYDRGGVARPKRAQERALAAAHRPLARLCELQGLPPDFFDHAPFTVVAKKRAVASGVPLFTGRVIARAVRDAVSPSATCGHPPELTEVAE